MTHKLARWLPIWFANVYETDKERGGPEEGGWYYDCGTPVRSAWCGFLPLARLAAGFLRKRALNYNLTHHLHPPHSVLSEGEWRQVYIEARPAKPYPARPPCYE